MPKVDFWQTRDRHRGQGSDNGTHPGTHVGQSCIVEDHLKETRWSTWMWYTWFFFKKSATGDGSEPRRNSIWKTNPTQVIFKEQVNIYPNLNTTTVLLLHMFSCSTCLRLGSWFFAVPNRVTVSGLLKAKGTMLRRNLGEAPWRWHFSIQALCVLGLFKFCLRSQFMFLFCAAKLDHVDHHLLMFVLFLQNH